MGRQPKFTKEDVKEIKRLYNHGTPKPWKVTELAHNFNTSEAATYQILNNKYKPKE